MYKVVFCWGRVIGVSGSEEEIYSVMFSSLRHPARRKILRMLSERKVTYSQMLEELAITSSHLTYHLENLGELVLKDENGKYELSSFGKAAVTMMRGAEEVPDTHAKSFSTLSFRWKSLYALFIIAIVLLASLSYVEFSSFNKLSSDFSALQRNYNIVKEQNQQLLISNSSNNAYEAKIIMQNVLQIDTSKYQVTLTDDTLQNRADLGGVVEEILQYSLVNNASRFDLTMRFRNGHFSLLQISQLEGAPNFPLIYTEPQQTGVIQACQGLLGRYQSAFNDSYMDQISSLMASVNTNQNSQTLGNSKLQFSSYDGSADVLLMYTENETDFQAKSIHLTYQNNILAEFSDDWALFKVGSTQVNISKDQAVLIAKNAAKTYSWTANGQQVTSFQILDNPVSAQFYPKTRGADVLTLYPYWYVTLYLDKTYPGGVSEIAVGVWADTGQIASIQSLATS
jgi:DNA-binding transcriptional ArsR family regulator